MPRKKKISEESVKLWYKTLPAWKKRTLQILAQRTTPITTGELLDQLLEENHEVTLAALYHFLNRLEQKGLINSIKVFMSNKRAWKLIEEYRETIMSKTNTIT